MAIKSYQDLGTCDIAINNQYRICFQWDGVDASGVEITDYH
jgi:plasmid maintenance system killer protein